MYMIYIIFFFFNDTATTEIYTLSLHDALPIFPDVRRPRLRPARQRAAARGVPGRGAGSRLRVAGRRQLGHLPGLDRLDRKSTRLNSSHANISYAVFCLKKKK